MKKFLSVLLAVITIVSVFSACSKASENSQNVLSTSAESTSVKESTSKISTENADVTDMQAIDIVKNKSKKKLKLQKDVEEYRWLVSTSGIVVNDINCYEVNACIIDDKDEKNPKVETKAVYYVSFDGKTVMMKDDKASKIVEIK